MYIIGLYIESLNLLLANDNYCYRIIKTYVKKEGIMEKSFYESSVYKSVDGESLS